MSQRPKEASIAAADKSKTQKSTAIEQVYNVMTAVWHDKKFSYL